jgi:hypothetical protein
VIAEISKSIKATLYDRIVSPVSGMFLLSWGVWNWKLCLVLFFANYGVDQKISTISTMYINKYDNIIYPVLTTCILMFAYPVISIFPTRTWEWASAYKSKMKHKYSLQVHLTLEQSILLKQELEKEKLEFNNSIDNYKLKYEQEKATSKELGMQLSTIQGELDSANKTLGEYNKNHKPSPEDEFETSFNIASWREAIAEKIMKLSSGDKITFKELVPQNEWYNVTDVKRKMLGKEFKQKVDRGDFVGLIGLPEKTTSNEQLYAKV